MIEEKKHYYNNGQLWLHCFYKDNVRHGEYFLYSPGGSLQSHKIWVDGKLLDIDTFTLSNKDKLAIKLKYNIEFIDD